MNETLELLEKPAADCLPLDDARTRYYLWDWSKYTIAPPKLFEPRHLRNYNLEIISRYIRWDSLMPERENYNGLPEFSKTGNVGHERQKFQADAQKMLQQLLSEKWLKACAMLCFWHANRSGDDIELYTDSTRERKLAVLHTLRQQTPNEGDETYYAPADFIAPKETKVPDYCGGFVATVGTGIDDKINTFKAQGDDYRALLLQTLAQRLLEAFTEHLLERVRTEFWLYGTDKKHTGICPIVGSPTLPDISERATLYRLLEVEKYTPIRLNADMEWQPAASACGLYIAHPQARCLEVGKIFNDQLADYARRKQMPAGEVERFLLR